VARDLSTITSLRSITPVMTTEKPKASVPVNNWLGIWPLYLLLLEYLAISVGFDAKPLLEATGAAKRFGYLGILAPGLVVVATLSFVLSGPALRRELAQLIEATPLFGSRRRAALGVNVACFGVLWWRTAQLLGQVVRAEAPSTLSLSVYLLLAAACALSLLLALLPAAALRQLGPRAAQVLAAGLVAGGLAWAAGVLSGQLWQHMQQATLYLVFSIMLPFSDRLAFAPDEALIGTEDFLVEVAPECSGIEGIGLITVVMSVFLWSARARLRFPRALGLVPSAVVLVFLFNGVRIALLIAVGVYVSPEIALSGFHSKAGWLFFCAIALGLIALAQRSRWLVRPELLQLSAAEEDAYNATATYLLPLLALIATSLVTALFSSAGFDRFYGLRVATVGLALYAHRKHLPKPEWPPSWHAPAIGVIVFVVWLWLAPRADTDEVEAFRSQVAAAGVPWLALRVLGATIIVPIAEELAFRGYLLRRLIAADFTEVEKTRLTPLAFVGSSLAFGALHPGALEAACLAGGAYAAAQCVRGRMGDAIVAHALTNGLIALYVLVEDAYWLWL
jgi:exosortase E/protease (VPEID-CTERM system)